MAAAGWALLLGGCHSKSYKAAANEAIYDQIMPVKAYPAAQQAIRRAIQNDEDEPRLWLKLAQVSMLLGDVGTAAGAFQSALDLQPDNVEALQNLAMLYVRAGNYRDAKRYADPLMVLQPDNPVGQIVNGTLAVSERRFEDANRVADRLIAAYPEVNEGYVLKARALDAAGRSTEAEALLTARAQKQPTDVDLWRQLLQLQRKMSDDFGTQRTIIHMATLLPDDPGLAVLAARALKARGRDAEAERAIRAASAKFAGDTAAAGAIGRYWRDTAPRDVAHREVVALAGRTTPAGRLVLASVLVDMGDGAGALSLIGPQPGEVTSGNVDVRTLEARALRAAGRSGEARSRVDAVLRFDPSNVGALMLRAEMRLAQGDHAAALADAQLAAGSDPENERAALLVARIYAASGNDVLAVQAFGGAVRHFPDSLSAMRAYADWLVSRRRTDEAVALAREYNRRHLGDLAARAAYQSVCRAAGRSCAAVTEA